MPLDRAPEMYETFQKNEDGCIKVILKPEVAPVTSSVPVVPPEGEI